MIAHLQDQVSLDYALSEYDIPTQHILYANQLCPGLIDRNNGLVNLDRLGLATMLSIPKMPNLGFKISPRFKETINSWCRDNNIDRLVDSENEIIAARYNVYLDRALGFTYNAFRSSCTISGEELHQQFIDYSLNGELGSVYPKESIRKEIESNLKVLKNIITEFAIYFCPLGEREENQERLNNYLEQQSMCEREKLYSKLISFARILPSPHDREDIVSEYFLRLIDGRAKRFDWRIDKFYDISENNRFMRWSNILIRNLSISFLRKQRVMDFYLYKVAEREDYRIIIKGRCRSYKNLLPIDIISQEEIRSIIERNVRAMDPKYGKLIEMHFLNGFEYRDIAKLLDIPIGTVQSRLHHALEKFKILPEIARLGKLISDK